MIETERFYQRTDHFLVHSRRLINVVYFRTEANSLEAVLGTPQYNFYILVCFGPSVAP